MQNLLSIFLIALTSIFIVCWILTRVPGAFNFQTCFGLFFVIVWFMEALCQLVSAILRIPLIHVTIFSTFFIMGWISFVCLSNYIHWRPSFLIKKGLSRVYQKIHSQDFILDIDKDFRDLNRILHLPQNVFTSGNNLYEIWYFLTNEHSYSLAKKVFSSIFGCMPGTIAESYDLLWLLTICDHPRGLKLDLPKLNALAKMPNSELREFLPQGYEGTYDRPAMLLTLMSGYHVYRDINEDRYEKISKYPPSFAFSATHKKLFETFSVNGPYGLLSNEQENDIENLLLEINEDNYLEIANEYGTLIPSNLSPEESKNFVQQEISTYQNVFSRKQIAFPSINFLKQKGKNDFFEALSVFTSQELIENYEPRSSFSNRSELFEVLYEDLQGAERWSLLKSSFAKNDDDIHPIYGCPRKEIDKNDQDDPTISYGKMRNYDCYQISELINSFNDYDGTFIFRRPDYYLREEKYFPISSITQLQSLLKYSKDSRFSALLEKIDYGIKRLHDAREKIASLSQEYKIFNEKEKKIVELYLTWVFCFGMWMRFWKCPGSPWPVKQIHGVSVQERDEHVIIQSLVYRKIKEDFRNNIKLKNWIDNLQIIHFDISSDEEPRCAAYTIKDYAKDVKRGDEIRGCMGFGADHFVKSAYYYITEMLEKKEGKRFNDFINEKIKILLAIENGLLPDLEKNQTVSLSTIQRRKIEIANFVSQPGFTAHGFIGNRHT